MNALPALLAPPATVLRVQRATVRDVAGLESLIASCTSDGSLLPRSRANVVHHLRDFRVARLGDDIVGCGALQLVDAGLAEVRSVAVHPQWRGAGLGSRIVAALLRDARQVGLPRVFCLTRRQHFFARLGFTVVPRENFPHKIWSDCRLCPRQLCCDEIAMQRLVLPAARRLPQHGRAGHEA
jgi:amino-acid N-acetyltransferase